jgi:uncharacterized membrane protein YphA (DoxX/SURF4 family)
MIALRYLASAATGVALYCLSYHPWIPYAHREGSQSINGFLLAMAGSFLAALLLSWNVRPHRYRIAAAMLAGMFVIHAAVISTDWKTDPTDHNLLPFEFIILGMLVSPAFLGSAIGGRK